MSEPRTSPNVIMESDKASVLATGSDRHKAMQDFVKKFLAKKQPNWNKDQYMNLQLLLDLLVPIKQGLELDTAEKNFKQQLDTEVEKAEMFYEDLINDVSPAPHTSFIQSVTDPDELGRCIQQIEEFAMANFQAFKKIIDLHDQYSQLRLGSAYGWKKSREEFCPSTWIDPLLYSLSDMHDDERRQQKKRVISATSDPAALLNRYSFWVPKHQIVKLVCGLLKIFPVNRPKGESKLFYIHSNAVYFDDVQLRTYKKRVTGQAHSLCKMHWEDSRLTIMKRKYPRFPGQPSEKGYLPHKDVYKFMQGSPELKETLAKKDKKELMILEDCRATIRDRNLRANVKCEYLKTVFQYPDDDKVIVKLETQVKLIKELGEQDAMWPSSRERVPEHRVVHFPFALLTVKTPDKTIPQWLATFSTEGGFKQIKGFSKFVHGTAVLYKDLIEDNNLPFPNWIAPYRTHFFGNSDTPKISGRERTESSPKDMFAPQPANPRGSRYFGRSHYAEAAMNETSRTSRVGSIVDRNDTSRQGVGAMAASPPAHRSRAQSAYQSSRLSDSFGLHTPGLTPNKYSRGASLGEPLQIQFDVQHDYSSTQSEEPSFKPDQDGAKANIHDVDEDRLMDPDVSPDQVELTSNSSSKQDQQAQANDILVTIHADIDGNHDNKLTSAEKLPTEKTPLVEKTEAAPEKKTDKTASEAGPGGGGSDAKPSKTSWWTAVHDCFCVSESTKQKRLKIEPKTFFANERTFLQWFSAATLISSVGLALMGLNNSSVITIGYLFLPVAMIILVYAFGVFYSRVKKLENRQPSHKYSDVMGPAFITFILVTVLLFAMLVKGGVFGNVFPMAPLQLNSNKYILGACDVGPQLRTDSSVTGVSLSSDTALLGVASAGYLFAVDVAAAQARATNPTAPTYSVPLMKNEKGTPTVVSNFRGITSVGHTNALLVGVIDPTTGESSIISINDNVIVGKFTLPDFNSSKGDATNPPAGISGVACALQSGASVIVAVSNNYDNQIYAYEVADTTAKTGAAKLLHTFRPLQGAFGMTTITTFNSDKSLMVTYQNPPVAALVSFTASSGSFEPTLQSVYEAPDLPQLSGLAITGNDQSATAYVTSAKYDIVLRYHWSRSEGFAACLSNSE